MFSVRTTRTFYNVSTVFVVCLVIGIVCIGLYVDTPLARRRPLVFPTTPTTAPPTTTTTTSVAPSTTPTTTSPPPTTTPIPALVIACPPDLGLPLGTTLNPSFLPGGFATATGGCTTPNPGISYTTTQLNTTGFDIIATDTTTAAVVVATSSNEIYTLYVYADATASLYYTNNLTFTGNALANLSFYVSDANCSVSSFLEADLIWDALFQRWIVAYASSTAVCVLEGTSDASAWQFASVYPTALEVSISSPRIGLTNDYLALAISNSTSNSLCALNRTWPHNIVVCRAPFNGLLPGFSSSVQRWTPFHTTSVTSAPITGVVFFRPIDDEWNTGATMTPTTDYIEVEHWTDVVPVFNPVRYRVAVADFDSNTSLAYMDTPLGIIATQNRALVYGALYRPEKQSVILTLPTGQQDTRWIELRWLPPSELLGPRWVPYQQGTVSGAFFGAAAADAYGTIVMTFTNGTASFYPNSYATMRLDSDPLNTMPNGVVTLYNSPIGSTNVHTENVPVVLPIVDTPSLFMVSSGPVASFSAIASSISSLLSVRGIDYVRTWRAYDFCFDETFCNQTILTF